MEIFHNNGTFFSNYWSFTFKDEIGKGRGVTKEVFSILSKELQKHYIIQGESVERSSKETQFTQLPACLFVEVNEEHEKLIFFGQILAKCILDGHLLDIQLSEEFFQQLRTVKVSHLRREQYDLIRVFPLLESVFKQLLPFKRKVEDIRSDGILSQCQKQEMIVNLTFDDGNSFDDLLICCDQFKRWTVDKLCKYCV